MKTVYRLKRFAKKAGISLRHLQRLIAGGEGPILTELGERIKGVTDDDGDAWLAGRRRLPPGWVDPPSRQSPMIVPPASISPTLGPKVVAGSGGPVPKDSRRRRVADTLVATVESSWPATAKRHRANQRRRRKVDEEIDR
jgi:hypothetical protein